MKKILTAILILGISGLVGLGFAQTVSKLDNDHIQIVTTTNRTVSIRGLIQQKAMLEIQMNRLQAQEDAIDSQLNQASDLGVASATTAIQAKVTK